MNWLHGFLLLLLLSASSSATGPSRLKKDSIPPNDVSQNSINILDEDCLKYIATYLHPFEKKSGECASKHLKFLTEKEHEVLKPDIDATNKELANLRQKEEEAPLTVDDANKEKKLQQTMINLCALGADPKVVIAAVQKSLEELEREMKDGSGIMDEQGIRKYLACSAERLEFHLREHVTEPTRIKGAVKDAWKEKSSLERAVDDDQSHAVRFFLRFNRSYRPGQYEELLNTMAIEDKNKAIAALLEFASQEQFTAIFEFVLKMFFHRPQENKVLAFLLKDESTVTLMESAVSKVVVTASEKFSDPLFELNWFVTNLNDMLAQALCTYRIALDSNHAEPPYFKLNITPNP